jgi:hypothetical protein
VHTWKLISADGTFNPRDVELPPAPAALVAAVDRAPHSAARLAARLNPHVRVDICVR